MADKKRKSSAAGQGAESKKTDLAAQECYFNRELSWLDFNARVLETALDERLPLLEQTKFLSIFYNNLDEFFMVRVADVLRLYREGANSAEADRMTPSRQLAEIRRKASALLSSASEHWQKKLVPLLRERDVHLVHYNELTEKQRRFLLAYFRDEIYPVLTPQAIDPGHPFPTISNLSLNFIIQLQGRDGVVRFARLRCPSNVPRFIFIPRNKEAKTYASLGLKANVRDADILPLEELIEEHLGLLFPGYTVVDSGLFRITRNTDVTIDEDESDDLLEAVQDMVEQRRFGGVVRLETARGMSVGLSEFLMKTQENINGRWVPRPTDQRYNLSLYFTDYFTKNDRWKLSLKASVADGLPFRAPHSGVDGQVFKAPAYKRVDIGMSYRLLDNEDGNNHRRWAKPFKNIWLGLDCFNLLGINNVNSYYWVTDVYDNQFAVPNYLTGRQLNVRLLFEFR